MNARTLREVAFSEGKWTNEPEAVEEIESGLRVRACEGSDAWRITSYGFIHDSEHALLAPLHPGEAVEVEFTADFSQQFDQAGIFLKVDAKNWVKCATEYSDGSLAAGAVVTKGTSDWSLSACNEWLGKRVLIRASWDGSAVTVRAGVVGEQLRLLRVFPWDDARPVFAGPLLNAPTRSGLEIVFHAWRVTEADASLHPMDPSSCG